MSVSGPADPTGCGEGFSYSRLTTKVTKTIKLSLTLLFMLSWLQRESPGNLPSGRRYKNVMGTDGDLRKLKLSKAKALLRNFGVPEDEVKMTVTQSLIQRLFAHKKQTYTL